MTVDVVLQRELGDSGSTYNLVQHHECRVQVVSRKNSIATQFFAKIFYYSTVHINLDIFLIPIEFLTTKDLGSCRNIKVTLGMESENT